MLEQQIRAELEAEAWRRLRTELEPPPVEALPPPRQAETAPNYHNTGSAVLKGIVRFILAAFAGYLAFLAGVDSELGQFEVWLAIGATFLVTLALSMFGPVRGFVHFLAETARWIIILAVALGGVWLMVQMSA
ncbi:MAG: hypothetical protein AB7O98_10960 [Hyphomonadaceae bacterium]